MNFVPLILVTTLLAGGFLSSVDRSACAQTSAAPKLHIYVGVRRPDLTWVLWDETRSRSFLKDFWYWNQAIPDDTLKKVNTQAPDRNLPARLTAASAEGNVGQVVLVVEGPNIRSIDLSFQDKTAANPSDAYTLELCPDCAPHLFDQPPGYVLYMGKSRPSVADQIERYIKRDRDSLQVINGGDIQKKVGMIDRTGTFFLHVIDQENHDFFLPLASAHWHLENRNNGSWSEIYRVQAIVQ